MANLIEIFENPATNWRAPGDATARVSHPYSSSASNPQQFFLLTLTFVGSFQNSETGD